MLAPTGFCLVVAMTMLGVKATLIPDCVPKCWSNSEYVSTCVDDTACLCKDINFQDVVLQCLYSQCSTSQFGAALHHALGECAVSDEVTMEASPALLRRQSSHKRDDSNRIRSASVVQSHVASRAASVIQSATRSANRYTVTSRSKITLSTSSLPASASSLPTSSSVTPKIILAQSTNAVVRQL